VSKACQGLTDAIEAQHSQPGTKKLLLDTFVLTNIAADQNLGREVAKFIISENYVVAVSVIHLVEAVAHTRWADICDYLGSVPYQILPNP